MEKTHLKPVEYNHQRILTTAQLAEAYETNERRISENFNRNKERYTLGKHYFLLEGRDLKTFGDHYANCVSVERASRLYLWTEKGALLHAKSLNTDKAWDVYEKLVDEYYRLIQPVAALDPTYTVSDALRDRVLPNMKNVPRSFFTPPGELLKHLHNLEKLLNISLDNKSEIEKSVGRRWSDYARSVLHIPEEARCRYPHTCPNGYVAYPWAYSILYVADFDYWIWQIYFPEEFGLYMDDRAKRISAQFSQKRISTKGMRTQLLLARSGMVQQLLFSEVTV